MYVIKCKTEIGDTDQYLEQNGNLVSLKEAKRYDEWTDANLAISTHSLYGFAKVRRFIPAI